jgi:4-hydroxy-3-polyprenylbenzoate decarboxylase
MSSSSSQPRQRLIVAITGATGAIYGVRLLEHLRKHGQVETHLMISEAGVLNLHQELDMRRKDVEALADVVHQRARRRCLHRQRLLRLHRHGGGALFDEDPGGRGAWPVRQPHHPRSRRGPEGTPSAGADGARNPFNLAHLRNMTAVTEDGRRDLPAAARLLPAPCFHGRNGRSHSDVLDMFGISMQLTPEGRARD